MQHGMLDVECNGTWNVVCNEEGKVKILYQMECGMWDAAWGVRFRI